MVASDNLAGREEFAPIVEYADRVVEHFAIIRGRNVIPPKSRDAVLGKHEALRVASGVRKDLNIGSESASRTTENTEPEVTYIFHRTPASTLPLNKLSKVYLKNLKWCEEIKGSVLVVRTLTEPCYVEGALCAVVEDETSAVHNLRLYNVTTKERDESSVLPLGVIVAIKEPYCEAATESTSGIRVDHPSDLLYITEEDPHFPDSWRSVVAEEARSEKLKEEGNDYFKRRLLRPAVSKYALLFIFEPFQYPNHSSWPFLKVYLSTPL